MHLSDMRFALVFEFLVRTVVGDVNLVSLFKWSVKTILATHYPLVHSDVVAVAVLVS